MFLPLPQMVAEARIKVYAVNTEMCALITDDSCLRKTGPIEWFIVLFFLILWLFLIFNTFIYDPQIAFKKKVEV